MNAAQVVEQLKQRFPNEPEYIQAVSQVLPTIEEEYNKHPEFEKSNLIERLCIPDRLVEFRVTWTDDKGNIQLEAIDDADMSYQRFTTLTNVNQSVQYVTSTPNGTLNIEIPTGQASTRDWVVYCNFTAEKTPISLPAATWWMADEAFTNAIPANQPTALYFTQVADGVYMLSRQELTSVLIQTGE